MTAVESNQSGPTQPASAYLGRHPILTRDGALAGFELLFRSSDNDAAQSADEAAATAQILVTTIGDVGTVAALGPHNGYVQVGREILMSELVLLIPPHRFVLELAEALSEDEEVLARCVKLKQYGYKIALEFSGALTAQASTALAYADVVKLKLKRTEPEVLAQFVDAARAQRKTLLADQVETAHQYQMARRLGFDLFQGYYFAQPQTLVTGHSASSRSALLRLIALLAGEPTLNELEQELKFNPNLITHIVRLINSSALGVSRPISTLRQAIVVVGTRQIARWAQLLFYAEGATTALHSDPLIQTAGTRARLIELLANALRPDDTRLADSGFITGIFSLVHVVLGVSQQEVVELLPLSPEIRLAILNQSGELGVLLALAKATEIGDAGALQAACDAVNTRYAETGVTLDLLQVGKLSLKAAAWVAEHAQD